MIGVKRIITHEQYAHHDFDYGLIELNSKLKFSDTIQTIRLPNIDDAPIAIGALCLVTGWGNTHNSTESSLILRAVEVPIIDQQCCAKQYSNFTITSRMICAGFGSGGKDCECFE